MTEISPKKLLVIMGPTASGKSGLAIEIAKQYDSEIISADSRQVYRGMDIGTGKVTKEEQRAIPHHLLDVAEPCENYNVSHFVRDARVAMKVIWKRRKLPIICGGTGFWIQSLIENQALPNIPPDPKLREILGKLSKEELLDKLKELDPERAKTIDQNNPRRLIRAIEIVDYIPRHPREDGGLGSANIHGAHNRLNLRHDNSSTDGTWIPAFAGMTKQNMHRNAELNTNEKLFESSYILALCPPKDILDAKIRARLDERFKQGMIQEVEQLHQKGISWERLDSFGLEYRWISRFLKREISEETMKERLAFDIIHYAKRQMTWIRRWQRQSGDIHLAKTKEKALEEIRAFLEGAEKEELPS